MSSSLAPSWFSNDKPLKIVKDYTNLTIYKVYFNIIDNHGQTENLKLLLNNTNLNIDSLSDVYNSLDCKSSKISLDLASVHLLKTKALRDFVHTNINLTL